MTEWFGFILHLDVHLQSLASMLGPWTLVALFVVIFCETGLVVTPFLPGDSLLFAAGSLSALQPEHLPIGALVPWLLVAAILGDAVNFEVGSRAGTRVEAWLGRRPGGTAHVERAREFFLRHGGKAIVMARFFPMVRTFVPFVAGVAKMQRAKFTFYNVLGGILWIVSFTVAGHMFGNIPAVKSNLHYVILGIMVVTGIPVALEILRAQRSAAVAVPERAAAVAVPETNPADSL